MVADFLCAMPSDPSVDGFNSIGPRLEAFPLCPSAFLLGAFLRRPCTLGLAKGQKADLNMCRPRIGGEPVRHRPRNYHGPPCVTAVARQKMPRAGHAATPRIALAKRNCVRKTPRRCWEPTEGSTRYWAFGGRLAGERPEVRTRGCSGLRPELGAQGSEWSESWCHRRSGGAVEAAPPTASRPSS